MPDELAGFSECFITGTAAEVTAVSEIAHWNFTPGGITKQLMDDYTARSAAEGQGRGGRKRFTPPRDFLRPQQRDIAHAVLRDEAVHALVEHAAAALRGVPQQQVAVVAEGDEADVEIIQIRPLRDEADDVAGRQLRPCWPGTSRAG